MKPNIDKSLVSLEKSRIDLQSSSVKDSRISLKEEETPWLTKCTDLALKPLSRRFNLDLVV
jgi:hypothetical protein